MNALLQTLRTRWVVIALAVAAVAFVAGVNYGLRTSDGIGAQAPTPPDVTFPPPTDEEWEAMLASRPERKQFTIYPVVVTPDSSSMSKAEAEYAAADQGRAIYLWDINKTVHLPNGVDIEDIHHSVGCWAGDPENPDDKGLFPKCPSTPLHILKTGESVIGLDASGRVFDYSIDGDTIKRFSFLKGYEVVNLIWD